MVIGDMHGAYLALDQCLTRSKFNKKKDLLITLGDICDGWSQTPECINLLLTIENRIDIRGNHDKWLLDYFMYGTDPSLWRNQGGNATIESYEGRDLSEIVEHRDFLKNQHYFYIDDENRLFVHGGFDWHIPFQENDREDMTWDRHAFTTACMWEAAGRRHPDKERLYFKDFKEVFVGHTATTHGINWRIGNSLEPLHVSNLWNLDQGAGWDGKLSIMDVNTKEFWQSDPVSELYNNEVSKR